MTLTREWQGLTLPEPGTFTLDPTHAEVGFVAKHMMFAKVRGSFADVSGTLHVGETPESSSVEVAIKTDSITTGAADRDTHLRSDDFFDVETHPEITFRSTEIRATGGSDFILAGDLTIRGVTKPVELDATLEGVGDNPWGVQVVGVSARAEIDREDWGLTWNANLEAGGVLVGKRVKLEIEAEFNRA
ncbi:MAG TPA: YceI family protein [Jiangellaceae bacterium]|nr:YceI family protein [Jiangellaceae bacterium]